MFNTTVIKQGTKEYVPYVKEIKRAPTDKSVELLNEMQEKARKNIIDSISLRNNIFDATFFVSDSPHDFQKVITYKYLLNGNKYHGEIKGDFDFGLTRYQVLDIIREKIADSLFQHCIGPLANQFYENILDKRY